MATPAPTPAEQQALARLKAGDAAGAETDLVRLLSIAVNPDLRTRLSEALAEARLAQGFAFEAAEALKSVAASDPRLALRRIRMLVQAGKLPRALSALRELPAGGRQGFDYWSLKADALRQSGRWNDAAEAAGKALAINPKSRNMALVRAAGLGHAGRWSEAAPVFRQYTDYPPAIEMHAGALVGSGRTQEARALLAEGIGRFPGNSSLLRAQAMIAWMEGEKDTFADAITAAANANTADVALGMAAADLLRSADRMEEALERLNQLRRTSPMPELDSAAATLLSALGQHDAAIALANGAAARRPRVDWIRRNAAGVLLAGGSAPSARSHTTWGLELDAQDQEWIALDAVVRRASGDDSYRRSYDYSRFVQAYDLAPPPGYQTIEAFLEALANRLRELHGFSNHPLEQSLRGGSQLQLNPNVPQDPLVEKLLAALKRPISEYISVLGRDPAHPFLAPNTGKWRMQGAWSVRLVKGGNHVNHIHSEGWISSAFYVVVPSSVRAESNSREGWITFGAPPFKAAGLEAEHSVCPKPGRLVLFPSYMWHGVNAFSEDAERISVAFDIVPD